ncbi:MAG: 2-amino-4-hydroxy-6-hydroxymethyldihydropteridine diphosphokinase [Rhizobiaceae bacterium]
MIAVTAYLGLGGNLGDPMASMAAALRILDAHPDVRVVAVSSVYKTPPWGKTDQPDFLNAVAKVETTLSPHVLLDQCLEAERRLKRERKERWGPRIVDLDVLWFADRKIHEDGLEIPHPRMLERAFVLVPLAEIAPDLVLDDMSARQRAEAADRQGIEKLPGEADWWRWA